MLSSFYSLYKYISRYDRHPFCSKKYTKKMYKSYINHANNLNLNFIQSKHAYLVAADVNAPRMMGWLNHRHGYT